jgi:hypothetical protein
MEGKSFTTATSFTICNVQFKFCAGPSLSAWLFVHLVIPSFRMVSNIFLLILRIRLSLPYPTTRGLSIVNSIRIHIFHCVHEEKCTTTHVVWDSFAFSSCSWGKMHNHTWCSLRFFCLLSCSWRKVHNHAWCSLRFFCFHC